MKKENEKLPEAQSMQTGHIKNMRKIMLACWMAVPLLAVIIGLILSNPTMIMSGGITALILLLIVVPMTSIAIRKEEANKKRKKEGE